MELKNANKEIRARHLHLSEIRARLLRIEKLILLADSPSANKEILRQMFLNQKIMTELLNDLCKQSAKIDNIPHSLPETVDA